MSTLTPGAEVRLRLAYSDQTIASVARRLGRRISDVDAAAVLDHLSLEFEDLALAATAAAVDARAESLVHLMTERGSGTDAQCAHRLWPRRLAMC